MTKMKQAQKKEGSPSMVLSKEVGTAPNTSRCEDEKGQPTNTMYNIIVSNENQNVKSHFMDAVNAFETAYLQGKDYTSELQTLSRAIIHSALRKFYAENAQYIRPAEGVSAKLTRETLPDNPDMMQVVALALLEQAAKWAYTDTEIVPLVEAYKELRRYIQS